MAAGTAMTRAQLIAAGLTAAITATSPPAEEAAMHAPSKARPVLLEIAAAIRALAAEYPQLARFQSDALVRPDGIFYDYKTVSPAPSAKVRDGLLHRPSVPLPLAGGALISIRWLPDDAMPPQDKTTAVGRLEDGRRYAVDLRVGGALDERLWKVLEDHGWRRMSGGPRPPG